MNGADAVRAFRAGRDAARASQPLTACPWRLDAPTPQERALALLWHRGYDRVNPFPIDYSG